MIAKIAIIVEAREFPLRFLRSLRFEFSISLRVLCD
jgi:hypothetical protein